MIDGLDDDVEEEEKGDESLTAGLLNLTLPREQYSKRLWHSSYLAGSKLPTFPKSSPVRHILFALLALHCHPSSSQPLLPNVNVAASFTGSLVDIEFLFFEAGALVDYSNRELVNLIRALFADTVNRTKLIERIENAQRASFVNM